MLILYSIFSLVVLVIVGLLTWRHEVHKGEDYEPDEAAITKNVVIAFLVLVVLWKVATTIASLLVDYWWFQEVGQTDLWITKMSYQWGLWLVALVATYFALSATEFFAHFSMPKFPSKKPKRERPLQSYYQPLASYEAWQVRERYYRVVTRLLKLLIALGFAWGSKLFLNSVLKFQNLVAWGRVDPIFGLDYSFYDVVLPLARMAWWGIFGLLVAAVIYTACVYWYLHDRTSAFDAGAEEATTKAVIDHAFLYGAVLALMFAFSVYLDRFSTLVDGSSSVISAAGYVNITGTMPGLVAMIWLWVIIALAMIVAVFVPTKIKAYVAYGAGGAFLVVWLVAMVIIPWVKKMQFNTNPLGFETPYIEYQMAGTRFAFDLEDIQDQGQLGYTNQLSTAELHRSDATLSQTRIVDWEPMLSANETLNEYLPFYNFVDVDIDRYGAQEVMLSVRELNQDQIPEDARNWVNLHFRYTHGYGFTVASISEVDAQGEPRWLVRNMPPTGPEEFMVVRPEIYFGEDTTNFIFVNGSYTEFGRPEGTTLQEVTYDGPAGIPIGGFWRRMALALILDDYRLVFTSLIDQDSRIIFNRTLDQRLRELGWFLRCDEDPYAVLGGEEIVYVRDCYTVSDSLPYSDLYDGVRYIRGSVKMTVGAWSGDTNFYVVDPSDPIIQTWMAVFPNLFRPIEEMPGYLREHLRYPDDLIRAQADAYALYHVDTPVSFFNRQDLWERARETQTVGGEAEPADPRYVMMAIPGSEEEEFVSTVFFTPVSKQNVVAGMIARCDGDAYGQVVVFQFPRDETVIGFQMLEARIRQNEGLTSRINVLNLDQEGSSILWGQTIGLVLPAEDGSVSIAYVRSVYLQSREARIPSVKLVILSQGNRLVYASTLQGALELLYGGQAVEESGVPGEEVAPSGSLEELVQQARQHFEAAQSCLTQSDWVCFGREMQALQTVLDALP